MTQARVIEGTPKQIRDHLDTLNTNVRLTLIVPADSEPGEIPGNLFDASPEERARALDEIAAMNRHLPALPEEAFRRENLYEERL